MLKTLYSKLMVGSVFIMSCGSTPAKKNPDNIVNQAKPAANEVQAPGAVTASGDAAVQSVRPQAPVPLSDLVFTADQNNIQSSDSCFQLPINDLCRADVGTLERPIEVDGQCLASMALKLCANKSLHFRVKIHPFSYVSISVLTPEPSTSSRSLIVDPNLVLDEVNNPGLPTSERSDSWALNYEMISWQNSTSSSQFKLIRVHEANGKAASFHLLSVENPWTPFANCGPLKKDCYQIDQFPSPNSAADGYHIKIPEFAYLRREMIDVVMDASKRTHAAFPAHSPVSLLNMSYIDGSVSYDPYVRCARMGHVLGYDIDISYLQKDLQNDGKPMCDIDPMSDQCIPGTVDRLDRQASAYFIVQLSKSAKVRFTLSDVEIIKQIVVGGDELYRIGKISKQDHDLLSAKTKLKDLMAIHYSHMHVQSVYDAGPGEETRWNKETNYLREHITKLQPPQGERHDDCKEILKKGA